MLTNSDNVKHWKFFALGWALIFAMMPIAYLISPNNKHKEEPITTSTTQEKTCQATTSCCDAIKNCLCSCKEKSY